MLTRNPNPFRKPQKRIVVARHQNPNILFPGKAIPQFATEGERQLFLLDSAQALRSAVNAAMPRIDHNRKGTGRPIFAHRPNRLFTGFGGTCDFLATFQLLGKFPVRRSNDVSHEPVPRCAFIFENAEIFDLEGPRKVRISRERPLPTRP